MTSLEISAIKKIVEGSNTLTEAWGCGPVKIDIKEEITDQGPYNVTIECPTGYYAIYLANFLALVCTQFPRVNDKTITIK